jgi:hypothetical protein
MVFWCLFLKFKGGVAYMGLKGDQVVYKVCLGPLI